jgi:LysR family nitrogen assimilation transcriptional regulator
MNSDDLECFARVANCGSISRAALELGSDQSTISRQMLRLEASTCSRLFHRGGRGVVLTDAGRTLLEHARRVTETVEEARRAIHAFSGHGPAELVIGAQATIARTVFGPVGSALRKRFPRTRLRFAEGSSSDMPAWLASGNIDVAVLYLPSQTAGLKIDILLQEQLRLVLPAGGGIDIDDEFAVRRLGEMPLILPSAPHGLRLLAEAIANRVGISLHVAMECDASISVTKRLVQNGCGYSLLPLAAVAEEVASGTLRTARLVGADVTREVAMATARNRPGASELWSVIQTVRQQICDTVRNGGWPDAQLRD